MTVSIGEAAGRLGVSVSTVRRRIATGDIKVLAIGRRRVVPVAELQRLVERK